MHNFELLDCKFEAQVELDQYFNTMLDACMVQCDQELLPLEARIAELKALMLSTDQQIPHVGPDVKYRNREVQQMLYPHPPVCLYFRSPLLLCFSHFFTNTHFLSLSSRSILIMSLVLLCKQNESHIKMHTLQMQREVPQFLVTSVLRGQFEC